MQTLHWTILLCVIAGSVVGGVVLDRLVLRPTTTLMAYSTDTLTEYVYKDPKTICDTVYISKSETLYVDSTTPIGMIPLRTHKQEHVRTLVVDKNVHILKHLIETDYRGIIYAQRQNPQNDTFCLNIPKSNLSWHGGLNIWIDQSKCLSADIEGGMKYKRFNLKAKVETDHEYNVKLKAGIGINL